MKNVYATMLAVLLCANGYATDYRQGTRTEKFDAMSLITMQQMQSAGNTAGAKAAGKSSSSQSTERFAATVKLAKGADLSTLAGKGFNITPLVKDFAVVSTTIDSLQILAGYNEVERISFAKSDMNLDLAKAHTMTGVNSVHQGTGTSGKSTGEKTISRSYTGKGVMIGIFDEGFDPNHAMFLDKNGKSRFKVVLLKNGTVYTDSAKIASVGTDYKYSSHATHVSGIAAGHYKGDNFEIEGVAPEADLAMGPIMQTASELQSLKTLAEYCKEKGQRLVTNMSYGTTVGPHDGSDMYSQVLNELIKEYDIVACNSAGNCGNKMLVQKHTFTSSTDEMKALYDLTTAANSVNSYITTSTNDPINLEFFMTSTSDNCQTILARYPAIVNGEVQTLKANDSYLYNTTFNIAKETIHDGLTGYAVTSSVSCWDSKYRLGYIITSAEGQQVIVYNDNYKPFITTYPEYSEGVTSNGTANSSSSASDMIVVGSYITTPKYTSISGTNYTYSNPSGTWGTKEGEVAYTSSYGTRYDGTEWPCVVAPGAYIVSSFNRYYSNTSAVTTTDTYNGNTYKFCAMSGTSMASPYMAGVAALWLEANPTLTHQQIKEIAQKTADVDDYCLEGNHFYSQGKQAGAGKINALAGIEYILNETEGVVTEPTDKSIIEEPVDTLVLDENEAMPTGCAGKKHVILKHSFKSGTYNMVALPFDMDATQIADVFGSGTKVYSYDTSSLIILKFNSTDKIEANKPFIMTTSTKESTFDIGEVEVVEGTPVIDGTHYDFVGNYDGKKTLGRGHISTLGKLIYRSLGKSTITGFNAYLTPASSNSSAKAVSMSIDGEITDIVDGETTGIDNINADGTSTAEIYNISGQKISGNNRSNLQKGVYIQNGRKYIAR